MSKSLKAAAKDFFDIYYFLKDNDRELFSRLCNKLLTNNFIYGQIKSDREDYRDINRLKTEITNYFYLIDYSLEHDSNYKIFYLRSNDGKGKIKLKKMESVLVLLFRKLYYVKSKETGTSVEITVTFDELSDEINKTHLFKDKMTKQLLKDSLLVLRRFKLIYFDSTNFNTTDLFEIYPTIIHVVTTEDLKLIENKLASYQNADDEESEDETDED